MLAPLRLDVGCTNRANWTCRFEPVSNSPEPVGKAVADVERGMVALGYGSHSRHPALKVFRRRDGHELAWVVSSGRVQIRVPLSTEVTERETAARRVWRDLGSCLNSSPQESS